MANVKILVAFHKKSVVVDNPIYLPIQVNKINAKENLGFQGDDDGNNISFKNPLYCEMTAVYWGWKNLDADYYGLFHYRRYFTRYSHSFIHKIKRLRIQTILKLWDLFKHPGLNRVLQPLVYAKNTSDFIDSAEDYATYLNKIINDGGVDAVFGEPHKFTNSNNFNYFSVIGRKYLETLICNCKKLNPDFYKYLDHVLTDNVLYAANMFVMKKNIFMNYCDTIFPILDSVVEDLQRENWVKDMYNEGATARFVGYLAELLTSAYAQKMKSEKFNVKFSKTIILKDC